MISLQKIPVWKLLLLAILPWIIVFLAVANTKDVQAAVDSETPQEQVAVRNAQAAADSAEAERLKAEAETIAIKAQWQILQNESNAELVKITGITVALMLGVLTGCSTIFLAALSWYRRSTHSLPA